MFGDHVNNPRNVDLTKVGFVAYTVLTPLLYILRDARNHITVSARVPIFSVKSLCDFLFPLALVYSADSGYCTPYLTARWENQ